MLPQHRAAARPATPASSAAGRLRTARRGAARHQPHLERPPRGIGRQATQAAVGRGDHARAGGQFLVDQVAEHAPAGSCRGGVGRRRTSSASRGGTTRHRHHLRVRMRQPRAGLGAVVLEDQRRPASASRAAGRPAGRARPAGPASRSSTVIVAQVHRAAASRRPPRARRARACVLEQAFAALRRAPPSTRSAGTRLGTTRRSPARAVGRGAMRARPDSRGRPPLPRLRTAGKAPRRSGCTGRDRNHAGAAARRRPSITHCPVTGSARHSDIGQATTCTAVYHPGRNASTNDVDLARRHRSRRSRRRRRTAPGARAGRDGPGSRRPSATRRRCFSAVTAAAGSPNAATAAGSSPPRTRCSRRAGPRCRSRRIGCDSAAAACDSRALRAPGRRCLRPRVPSACRA